MQNLTKDEFNNLQIDQQIQYFNERLIEKSVTKICDDIGINRSTVRKRFQNNKYVLDTENNLYVNENTYNTPNTKDPSNTIYKKSEGSINLAYMQGLERQISDLKNKYDSIADLIKNTINYKAPNVDELGIKRFEGELVPRVYKIDEDIHKDFTRFCKKIQRENEDIRISDIISSILDDYMKKHK